MKKILILVAGMPGAGKTRFANYLSEKLKISIICKDKFKEIIWDKVHYDTTERSESKIYASLAYDLSFYLCDMLMNTGQSIIFESNFTNAGVDVLEPMVQKYGYKVITVLFGGDSQVIHRRFVERDVTTERHPGLVTNGFYDDFEVFKKAAQNCGNFKYGDVMIYVDSTDFSKVSYDDLIEKILSHK